MEKKSFSFEEIKQKIVNYCVYQDRCHSEVEQKMKEFQLIPEAKDEILLYLIKENYLNEERFTRSYIRGKFYQKKWGRNKIRNYLYKKGITDNLINKCWDEIRADDYQNTLKSLAIRYYKGIKGLKAYQKKSKTIVYLLGKGFEIEHILNAFQIIEE